MKKFILFLLIVFMLLLSPGCKPTQNDLPRITFIEAVTIAASPASSAYTSSGLTVQINLNIHNFDINKSPPVMLVGRGMFFDNPKKSNQGFIRYYLDAMPDSKNLSQIGSRLSTDTSITWEGVSPGYHFFAAELVDNFGNSLIPPVFVVQGLVVQPPASLNNPIQTSH
jgi:hypothetical protein